MAAAAQQDGVRQGAGAPERPRHDVVGDAAAGRAAAAGALAAVAGTELQRPALAPAELAGGGCAVERVPVRVDQEPGERGAAAQPEQQAGAEPGAAPGARRPARRLRGGRRPCPSRSCPSMSWRAPAGSTRSASGPTDVSRSATVATTTSCGAPPSAPSVPGTTGVPMLARTMSSRASSSRVSELRPSSRPRSASALASSTSRSHSPVSTSVCAVSRVSAPTSTSTSPPASRAAATASSVTSGCSAATSSSTLPRRSVRSTSPPRVRSARAVPGSRSLPGRARQARASWLAASSSSPPSATASSSPGRTPSRRASAASERACQTGRPAVSTSRSAALR